MESLFGRLFSTTPHTDDEDDPLAVAARYIGAGAAASPEQAAPIPEPAAAAGSADPLSVAGAALLGSQSIPDDDSFISAANRLFGPLPSRPIEAPPAPASPAETLSLGPAVAPAPVEPRQPPRQPFKPSPPPELPELEPPAPSKGKRKDPTRADVLAENEAGVQLAEKGIDEGARNAAARAEYLASEKLRALEDEQAANEIVLQARQEIEDRTNEDMRKIGSEIDALSKEEPRSYWKDQSTLGTIIQLIGVGLGGYGAAKTGKNVALDLLQRQIDRHAEAQARAHQQKLEVLRERKGAAKDRLASELSALDDKVKYQIGGANTAIKMIDAAAAKYDSAEVMAKRDQMVGELRQKNATLLEELRAGKVKEGQEAARISLANKSFEESKRQFDVQSMMALREAQAKGDEAAVKRLTEEATRHVFVEDPKNPGTPIVAPTEKVAEALNKQRGAGEYLYSSIGRALDQIGDDSFKVAPLSEKKRRVVAVIGDLENAWSALNEQGVITAADAARYAKLFGEPNALISNVEMLRQVRGLVVDKINANLRERTGRQDVTWMASADPEYSTTVRPPGWKAGAAHLKTDVPTGRAAVRGMAPLPGAADEDEDPFAAAAGSLFTPQNNTRFRGR